MSTPCTLKNGGTVPLSDINVVSFDDLRSFILDEMRKGGHISSYFGDQQGSGKTRIYAVLSNPKTHMISVMAADVDKSVPSLTLEIPQLHLFERELFEQYEVKPEGHPWLKPVRFMSPHTDPTKAHPEIGVTDFYQVKGDEIHEVNVGPVHAGVIEPGCFRFQCHGETVFNLEISLGYQFRGVERSLMGGPTKLTLPAMEAVAGDNTVGHAGVYCELMESLSGTEISGRAQAIRAIGLEIERMTCHDTDLGALALDVGYLPVAMFCGRLRALLLNSSALICGSRFSRSMIKPGGVHFDIEPDVEKALMKQLEGAFKEVCGAMDLMWNKPSVMTWFEGNGKIFRKDADDAGLVGVAARACGIERDIRVDFPSGAYKNLDVKIQTVASCDVYARAMVRWLEFQHSMELIRELIKTLPAGDICVELKPLRPNSLAVGLSEGWRGEVCHVVITDGNGKFKRYKIKDPSFHNWTSLSLSLRGEQISHFPINNKSHNLSYCGHDL